LSKVRKFHPRIFASGIPVGWLGYELVKSPWAPAHTIGTAALTYGALATGGTAAWWWTGRRGSSGVIGRWSRRNRRNGGVASWRQHRKSASKRAMRKKATTLRPSHADLSRAQRRRVPVTEYGALIGKEGLRRFWSNCESVCLLIAPPRTGKTALLGCVIVDAPGPVIATSTKPDIVKWTAPLRQRRGPIHIFNPSNEAGWATTVKWSPLDGCTDVTTAYDRAADMIPDTTDVAGQRWDDKARFALGNLLHAAAIGGLSMRTVHRWLAHPNDETMEEVLYHLERSPAADTERTAALQLFKLNNDTKTSITDSVKAGLSWLGNPYAAAACDAVTEDQFSVEEFVRSNGTLYLIGQKNGRTNPLTTALTAEIARVAQRVASRMPDNRLDPPLTLVLDEAARICPVPLHEWSSDFGSRNITLFISVQGRSQLATAFGDDGAATIMNNSGTKIIYAGGDLDDLKYFSELSGERTEVTETKDADGKVISRSERVVPVISVAQLQQMPNFQALTFVRGMPPAIVRTPIVWNRRDVKKAVKAAPYEPVKSTEYASLPLPRETEISATEGAQQ
jgi:type IV secretion system protein VirD4